MGNMKNMPRTEKIGRIPHDFYKGYKPKLANNKKCLRKHENQHYQLKLMVRMIIKQHGIIKKVQICFGRIRIETPTSTSK